MAYDIGVANFDCTCEGQSYGVQPPGKMICLYEAIVKDLIKVFMHIANYNS